jgi:hypothetical protein
MFQDLRYGARVLLQTKGWTAVVVVSLALGIGANAALFSGINGMLLRKLPVNKPDELVRLRWVGKNDAVTSSSDYGYMEKDNGQDARSTFSYPMYRQFRKENQTMTDVFASAPLGSVNVVTDGHADLASAFITSGNYYSFLGVKAATGRLITLDDDQPGSAPVAVISYGYWSRRFGKDARAVGKVIQANNTPVTIVGVMDPEFTGVQRVLDTSLDISFPLSLDPQLNPPPPSGTQRLNQATYWLCSANIPSVS